MILSDIKKYFVLYKLELNRMFSFRFSFMIWAILHPLRLIILYFLWTSVYSYSGLQAFGGLTISELISYFVTSVVLDTYVGVGDRLSKDIYKSNIVLLFMRPIKVFWSQLSTELADRSAAVVFQMIPTAIFATFFLGYKIHSFLYLALAITSAVFALLISYEMYFILATTTFWTRSFYGTRNLTDSILYLASGWIIPISFYPQAVQTILSYTPLPYVTFFPNMIFLGKYDLIQTSLILALQIFWIIALYGVHRIIWHYAKRKSTGEGV